MLLPYYNDSQFLAECIESILRQSFKDFELILINHACTDNSEEIAKSFKDHRIKHVNLDQNMGAGGGLILKTFLANANGEYFKSFCADDVMEIDCLRKLSRYLDSNKSCVAVFGNMQFVNQNGKKQNTTWWKEKPIDFDGLLLGYYFESHSVLPYPAALVRMKEMRKLVIDNVAFGMFDMTLWVQFLIKDMQMKCIQDIVCGYRIHPNQESSSDKLPKLIRISNFEAHIFYNHFLHLNLKQLKKLLPNDKFSQICDEKNVDFVVAHHFSLSRHFGPRWFGLHTLHSILQIDHRRIEIKEKFNYTVRDLRENYSEYVLPIDFQFIRTSKILKELRRRFRIWRKSILSKKKLGVC